ncbi:hypothetical protein QI237_10915 [Staphylococcus saprophyticus]|uniref:hypothetical protein n=1 Tax=Staphylococcus saprophyticus TaxID=29385 RepID=UPI00119CCAB0|nr:hypothetical protein [Staphylococcus saprophyticus]MDW4206526.1 hypothetical protein [Staphylococcus saprophyticus]
MNNDIEDFLNSNDQIALVESQKYEKVLYNILDSLSNHFNKGIFYTNLSFKILMDNFKSSPNIKVSNYTITSDKGNFINGIEMKYNHFDKVKTKRINIGGPETFSIYYPLQSVLRNEKEYENLLNMISEDNSSKIILVILSSVDSSNIKAKVDRHIVIST